VTATEKILDFVKELARRAGGEEVVDVYWGAAAAEMAQEGWRVSKTTVTTASGANAPV